jgi:hypothetical protein
LLLGSKNDLKKFLVKLIMQLHDELQEEAQREVEKLNEVHTVIKKFKRSKNPPTEQRKIISNMDALLKHIDTGFPNSGNRGGTLLGKSKISVRKWKVSVNTSPKITKLNHKVP